MYQSQTSLNFMLTVDYAPPHKTTSLIFNIFGVNGVKREKI